MFIPPPFPVHLPSTLLGGGRRGSNSEEKLHSFIAFFFVFLLGQPASFLQGCLIDGIIQICI
ncbi:hypothetical protein CSUI_008142 [Cystoisospora suis]|uniref:Transmembrane protein n=1 Tax=Cystoisospora suis TaxID=483139 RepID=A0A2C6KND7_9APIC|nr:hypothetical protein CSUI_008142 [Cystoisospora suis]